MTTGDKFDSIVGAAKWMNIGPGALRNAIERNGTCRGYHFVYADRTQGLDTLPQPKVQKRPVVCTTTDDYFASKTEAARHIGVSRKTLSKAIRENRPCKGMRFVYADRERIEAEVRPQLNPDAASGRTRPDPKDMAAAAKAIAKKTAGTSRQGPEIRH